MKKRLIAVAATCIAVGGITAAIGGGMWQTWPIATGQAYCAVLSTGLVGSQPINPSITGSTICQVTVPAGPPALTGNELVPADTYPASSPWTTVPQGVAPANVNVPIILLDSGAYTYSEPSLTVANYSLVNPSNWLILDGTNTATAVNITLPGTTLQAALNGQQFHIVSAKNITTLLVSGAAGTSIVNAPTSLIVSTLGTSASTGAYAFIYDAPISTWFRTQ